MKSTAWWFVGELREGVEDRRFVRVLDVRLERQDALGLHQLEQAELQPEQLDIGRLVVLRALEQGAEDAQRLLQHRPGIADDEGADRGAEDDHEFEGLHTAPRGARPSPCSRRARSEDDDDADAKTHLLREPQTGSRQAAYRRSAGLVWLSALSLNRRLKRGRKGSECRVVEGAADDRVNHLHGTPAANPTTATPWSGLRTAFDTARASRRHGCRAAGCGETECRCPSRSRPASHRSTARAR